jgi:type I restriction enzyme M protein
MLANPPFGVKWESQETVVEKEHKQFGFTGRFGPGLPRIDNGALLFLLTMLAKRKPSPDEGGEGSKIAIVFNYSPLFAGDAGSGESNIRRWIIENDWLDAIVALPDQLFYNTGIYTCIWLLTNRKPKHRRGKIQLIDATRHFQKMSKSLGSKRNELSEVHIEEIVKLYAEFKDGQTCKILIEDQEQERICSKIFDNREFGFIKLIIERPLRLNYQASAERIERLKNHSAFIGLAESKKRNQKAAAEQKAGRELQQNILAALSKLDPKKLYVNRSTFATDIDTALEANAVKLPMPVRKAVLAALSERDPTADICTDADGNPEPDSELRDTESVPLPTDIVLPLSISYDKEADNAEFIDLVRTKCEAYFVKEVQPHWPDAWIDFSKTKVGYEISVNRHFYIYEAPRPLDEIERDIKTFENKLVQMLQRVTI